MNLRRLITRALSRTLAGNLRNTCTVTLAWDSGVTRVDVNDLDSWTGSATPQTSQVKGLVHFPSAATILNRGFIELTEGDAIVDFAPDVVLDDKSNLSFQIDGVVYVQKSVGKQVVEYFDLLVGNERMFRTCVLTRKGS